MQSARKAEKGIHHDDWGVAIAEGAQPQPMAAKTSSCKRRLACDDILVTVIAARESTLAATHGPRRRDGGRGLLVLQEEGAVATNINCWKNKLQSWCLRPM